MKALLRSKISLLLLLFLCFFAGASRANAIVTVSVSPLTEGSTPLATLKWTNFYSDFGMDPNCGSGALVMYNVDAGLNAAYTNAWLGNSQVGVGTGGGNVGNTYSGVNSVQFSIGTPSLGAHNLYIGFVAVGGGNNVVGGVMYICSSKLSAVPFTIAPVSVPVAVNGSCSSTHYYCLNGTSENNVSGSTSYTWTCAGSNGGTTASCSEVKVIPVDGVCSPTHYNCTAGTPSSGVSWADSFTWSCNGSGGGATATCSESNSAYLPTIDVSISENPVPYGGDPAFTVTQKNCALYTSVAVSSIPLPSTMMTNLPGGASDTSIPSGTVLHHGPFTIPGDYQVKAYCFNSAWQGPAGGYSTIGFTVSPQPVSGQCGGFHYYCSRGTSVSNAETATAYSWECTGIDGGAAAVCSETKPTTGSCSATHYSCAVGTSGSNVNGSTAYTWTCTGTDAIARQCSETKAVLLTVGSCSAAHYSCTTGASGSNVSGATSYTWTCTGTDGIPQACSEAKIYACTGTLPANTTAYAAPDNTGLTADTAYAYSATDTAAKCQYSCSAGFTISGTSCVPIVYACTGLPVGATAYPPPDNTGLTANTAYTYSSPETGTKCQYFCSTGYFWNGTSCAPIVYTCTGTLPANTTAYPAPDNTGLIVDTAYSYSVTDTAAKCQFSCNAGFSWNGSSCAPIVYACTGTLPANTTAYPAPDNADLTVNTAYSYSATDTAAKCQFSCRSGFSWNGSNCIPVPSITATCKVSPDTGVVGDSFAWSVTSISGGTGVYTYLWSGTDGLSGTTPNIIKTYTTVGLKTGSVIITSGGNSQTFACTNSTGGPGTTVSVLPDLTVGFVSPSSATSGGATVFSAMVSSANASTGAGFTNLFQKATSAAGANAVDIGTSASPTIFQGSSAPATLTYTFPASGTYYVRVCADKSSAGNSGVITESDENNNCGAWSPVFVSDLPISGSCSVSPNSGFIGDSFTWATSGVSGGNGSYAYLWSGTDGLSGTSASMTKSYDATGSKTGSVTVTSGGNSQTFACTNSVIVTPCYGQGCVTTNPPTSGCAYSGPAQPKINVPAQCCASAPGVCPALPTATLSANPTVIDQGGSSMLTWNSTGASTCTIPTLVTNGPPGGNISTGVINNHQTQNYQVNYQITCTGPGGTSSPFFTPIDVLVPTATITASLLRVPTGGSTQLTWSASGVTSCTVTGPAGTLASGVSNGSHNFSTGSPRTVSITAQSTFTITCQTNSSPIKKSVVVNINSIFNEF